jgi:small subunit ribosomal protein S7
MKLFDKWSSKNIEIKDLGIKSYINLDDIIIPKSGGKHAKQQFYKSKLHIVERLINKLFVSGHRGKKHKIYSGHNVGMSFKAYNTVKKAFEIIEKNTNKNPIEVFVRALENSAPVEEVMSYQKGGIFVREGVITSPQRRVDLALKYIAQGTFQKSSRKKKKAYECLAEEIIAAFNNDPSSFAVSQKITHEKEASGAR